MSELIACHHKVTLDIAKRDVCTIEVVNRDTANILEVNVCEHGKEVSLENATLVTITYSNDTVDEMQISEDFKTAFIRINANCLKRGINFAKVCIYSGDNGLITAEMLTINCKQTVGSDNPSVPDPDMPKLKEMIAELVKQSASSEQIAAAVSQYLKDNPIIETDPTVPAWAKEKNKPTYTAAEVGALSEGALNIAINEALAAAKASGEFDGADGITPTIGNNGNWFLGDTDTGKPSRGADGKSAYSYAQEGGYTGTEAEFAAKLAAEGLDKALYVVNITSIENRYSADKTFEEITQVYNEGKYSIVAAIEIRGDKIMLPLINISVDRYVFISHIDGINIMLVMITEDNFVIAGSISTVTSKDKLPNPYPLTFTGAVNETYDGSSAKTITIPSGGGGGEKEWRLLRTISIAEAVASVSISQDDNGNAFEVEDIFIYAPKDVITSANTQLIVMFNDNEGNSSSLNDFLGTTAKSLFYESYWSGMRVSRMGSMTYDFAGAAGNAAIVRLNAAPQKINKIDLTLQGSTTFTAGTFYIYAR